MKSTCRVGSVYLSDTSYVQYEVRTVSSQEFSIRTAEVIEGTPAESELSHTLTCTCLYVQILSCLSRREMERCAFYKIVKHGFRSVYTKYICNFVLA